MSFSTIISLSSAGSDFSLITQTLILSMPSPEVCIEFDAFGDTVLEENENLIVTLSNLNQADNIIVAPFQARVTITDATGMK